MPLPLPEDHPDFRAMRTVQAKLLAMTQQFGNEEDEPSTTAFVRSLKQLGDQHIRAMKMGGSLFVQATIITFDLGADDFDEYEEPF